MRGRVVWCLFGVGGLGSVWNLRFFEGEAGISRTGRWHVIPLFVIPLFELK